MDAWLVRTIRASHPPGRAAMDEQRPPDSGKAYTIAMKRPSLFVPIALLLAAALLIVDNFLIKCALSGALAVMGGVVLSPAIRRARRYPARAKVAAVVGALFGVLAIVFPYAMLTTQPQSQVTFRPGYETKDDGVVDQRGFYRVETDPAQNQYVWTEGRATIIFDFLVHTPITLTVMMRSAAVAGGPDLPVQVLANGREAGTLYPDPANPAFQPLSLRFAPFDWGGKQTEIKLVPETFKPKGDARTLGTMIQSIAIDKGNAWSPLGRRLWLVWALPVLVLAVMGLTWAARRFHSSVAGYGAIAASLLGGGCAIVIGVLIHRIGFIQRDTNNAWMIGSDYFGLCFMVAAILLPFGPPEAASLLARSRLPALIARSPVTMRIKTRIASLDASFRAYLRAEPMRREVVRDLAFIFIIAFGMRLVWVVILPPWQATDETEHFAYANHIVEQHAIPHPPYETAYEPFSQELRQSLQNTDFFDLAENNRFYGKPESPLPLADYSTARTYTAAAGEARYDSGGARATPYPPLYYLFVAAPDFILHDTPITSRLFAMRATTAILGALSCVFAYLFAFEIRRTRRWGWSMGLCLALMPTFAEIGASLNNDTAVNLGAIVILWLTVRAYRRQQLSRALATMLGVASGLTLLTKPTAAPLIAIAGIVVLLKVVPLRGMPWPFMRERLQAFGLYTIAGCLSYGPWLLFHLAYYGNLGVGIGSVLRPVRGLAGALRAPQSSAVVLATISSSFLTFSTPTIASFPYSFRSYLHYLHSGAISGYPRLLFREFWGRFGWGGAYLPDPVLGAIAVVCAIGAVGLVVNLARQRAMRSLVLLLVGLIVLQILFIFIGVDYLQGYARTGRTLGLQGRYFFPIVAPFLFLILSGWEALLGERALALRIAPALMFVLQLIGLAAVFARYFGVEIA